MRAVHAANSEPIPGYRLIELLGSGGFGDVWKCEAPGGFFKALKFVRSAVARPDQTSSAEQEYRSLQHIKAIRHPFLLSIERVEVVDGELAVVMELADRSLQDLLEEYKAAGRNGLPRDELLHYLGEAAEALDLLNLEHGLQHLDIKPRNLFLVGRHVKVADFGLVNSVAEIGGSTPHAVQLDSITPIYAAPESFLGQLSKKCDQYSLAITYHELLTGCLPFTGRNFRQLALQHTQEDPDLRRLPEADRYAVGRALAKTPDHRFASCSEFVDALISGQQGPPASDPVIRRTKSPTDHEITPGHMAQTHPVPIRCGRCWKRARPYPATASSSVWHGFRPVKSGGRWLPAGSNAPSSCCSAPT
jgi:serine/threonine protein kinase